MHGSEEFQPASRSKLRHDYSQKTGSIAGSCFCSTPCTMTRVTWSVGTLPRPTLRTANRQKTLCAEAKHTWQKPRDSATPAVLRTTQFLAKLLTGPKKRIGPLDSTRQRDPYRTAKLEAEFTLRIYRNLRRPGKAGSGRRQERVLIFASFFRTAR